MRQACPTHLTSRMYKRSHNVHWKTTFVVSTPTNLHALASYCYVYRHCELCLLKSLNSCSSCVLSAKLQLKHSFEICYSVAGHSAGRTCPCSSNSWPISYRIHPLSSCTFSRCSPSLARTTELMQQESDWQFRPSFWRGTKLGHFPSPSFWPNTTSPV